VPSRHCFDSPTAKCTGWRGHIPNVGGHHVATAFYRSHRRGRRRDCPDGHNDPSGILKDFELAGEVLANQLLELVAVE
jgi:hypothetical protein